jgi:hypothetical protein
MNGVDLTEKEQWRTEKRALKAEMEVLRREHQRMSAREDKVEEMEDERERLEEMLGVAARQCGQARSQRVDRREHEKALADQQLLRMECQSRRSEGYRLRHELRIKQEEVEMLKGTLRDTENQRDESETTVEALLEERRKDRQLASPIAQLHDETQPMEAIASDPIDDMAQSHARLALLGIQIELRQTLLSYRQVFSDNDELAAKAATSARSVASLQQRIRDVEERSKTAAKARDAAAENIISLEQEVFRWQQAEGEVSAQLAEVTSALRRLEVSARGDREALKRANETVLRSKSAEEALEQELIR